MTEEHADFIASRGFVAPLIDFFGGGARRVQSTHPSPETWRRQVGDEAPGAAVREAITEEATAASKADEEAAEAAARALSRLLTSGEPDRVLQLPFLARNEQANTSYLLLPSYRLFFRWTRCLRWLLPCEPLSQPLPATHLLLTLACVYWPYLFPWRHLAQMPPPRRR